MSQPDPALPPPRGRPMVAIALGLALTAGGVWWLNAQRGAPQDAGDTARAPGSASMSETGAAADQAATPAGPARSRPPAAASERQQDPSAPAAPDPVALVFDTVRVEPDGRALVAGRAIPSRRVTIVVDGAEAGAAETDLAGNFVAFLDLGHSDAPRVMWLMAYDDGGAQQISDEQVIVAPRAPAPQIATAPDNAPLQHQPEPTAQTATRAPSDRPGDPPATAPRTPRVADATGAIVHGPVPEQTPGAASPPAPQAPTVLLSTQEGIALADTAPLADGQVLRLDTVTYGGEAEVVLRGLADRAGVVSVQVDGQAAGHVTVDGAGAWELRLRDIDPGTYRLGLALADDAGQAAALDLPFQRAAPETLGEAPVTAVTVQPGATLWAIARDRYGDGTRYVQVFEANRDAIGNPDLIYPGQVFSLPQPVDGG